MYNLVIGLDISKATVDATLVRFNSRHYPHDSFLNKELGFKQLLKWVGKNLKEEDNFLFCMEHTGHYAHRLIKYLEKNACDYSQVNPLKIKKSMGMRREKSDKADSKVIGMYGLKFQEEINLGSNVEEELFDLQLLLAHRKRIQDKLLSFQRQEKHLNHCLTSKTSKKIEKDIKKHKKYFSKPLKNVEQLIDHLLDDHPMIKRNYELLVSIPGIGRMIALYTIMHTRNFSQIKSARKFACYCGVAPFKNESGSSIQKGSRISFYANRKMKGLLNFGAMNAVKYEPELRVYYLRQVEKKNSKMSVLNAVRNKLIHRMYAVVKRGTPYVIRAQA